MTIRLRRALDNVPAYVPGKPAVAAEGQTVYKVSSNENPFPPLPSVLAAIADAAQAVNRYPDMAVAALTERIAQVVGVDAAEISTGTGSSAILGQLVAAMCDPGDEVVYAWRSFEAYPIFVALAGAVAVPVPLTAEHRHDLSAMAEAVTERTKVVIVCTPNNPSGTVVHAEELDALLARVPQDVLVVIDEAYVEFVRDDAAPDNLRIWRDHPNVMLMRTFSKAYGLAGLRVGYAIAHPELAAALRKAAIPFGVNLIAQAAALASLEPAAQAELDERVETLTNERARLQTALAEQGWKVPASGGNFVWFALGGDCDAFTAVCLAAGLVVRQYGTDGVRVTVGEPEATDRLIEVCAAFGAR